jgi:hypothetical protein
MAGKCVSFAVFACGSIAAGASGFDLWGAVVEWAADTFGLDNSMRYLACAITGQQPSSYSLGYDYEHPACMELKNLLNQEIEALISIGI